MMSPRLALPKLNANKKFWITFGVLVWLYFVLSSLPAIWGAYALTRGGNIAMNGVSGTLWSGRASLVNIKLNGQDYSVGQVTWKLHLLSFFTLKPCTYITTYLDNQQFEGEVCVMGKAGLKIKNASLNFPAALVQPLLPIAIAGQFNLNFDYLEIANQQLLSVRGKATWRDGRIYNGSNWMKAGDLGADLMDDAKNGLIARIVDIESPLKLELEGRLPYPAGASIKGTMALSEAYFQEINASAWLSMFAVPQANDASGNLVYFVDLNF